MYIQPLGPWALPVLDDLSAGALLRTNVFNHRTGVTKHQIRKLQSQKESVLCVPCLF